MTTSVLREPNFFIAGAPKCGTTSLAFYLASHRAVSVTVPKEPNYFARSLSVPGSWLSQQLWHTNLEDYLKLYANVPDKTLAAGEASTRYLRCESALIEIRGMFPSARLIVCLRNPVELAESWHAQKVREGQETELDFERAWRLHTGEEPRLGPPETLAEFDALNYSAVASLGSQLQQLQTVFPADQICTVFQDELGSAPRQVYIDVLKFLDVPDDGRTEFPRLNSRAGRNRSGGVVTAAKRVVKNLIRYQRAPEELCPVGSSPEFRAELTQFFEDEIRLIEKLTQQNLSHWSQAVPEAV